MAENKKQKEQEKETLVSDFELKSLSWKSGQAIWQMVVAIEGGISKAFTHYTARLVFDESPYDEEIKRLEGDLKEALKEKKLLNESNQQDVADARAALAAEKKHLETDRAQFPPIDFAATAISIDWRKKSPVVVFAVDGDLVEKINKVRDTADQAYKIELTSSK